MLKLKYKIWIENDGKAFGKGIYDLLNGVRKSGSLAEAAKHLGMSYNKAHNLIKNVEKKFGVCLLESKIGGVKGGSSQLTRAGENLMEKYNDFCHECEQQFKNAFEECFKDAELLE